MEPQSDTNLIDSFSNYAVAESCIGGLLRFHVKAGRLRVVSSKIQFFKILVTVLDEANLVTYRGASPVGPQRRTIGVAPILAPNNVNPFSVGG